MPQANQQEKKVLGAKLRLLRLERGYTQYNVSAAVFGSENRISDISKWESGKHKPNEAALKKLSTFFGVDL